MRVLILLFFFSFSFIKFYSQTEETILVLKGHKDHVNSVTFSENDSIIITCSDDKTMRMWDRQGKLLNTFTDENFEFKNAIYCDKEKQIITAVGPNIVVWDMDGTRLKTFNTHSTHVWSIDKYKNKLVSGSYEVRFKLTDLNEGITIHSFGGHTKNVLAAAFSSDGRYICSGSLDKTVKLWDANTFEQINSFDGHAGNIYDVCFSPCNKYFFTASLDKTIRMWSIDSLKQTATFTGHKERVVSIDISPDGKYLLSASLDKTVRLWEISTRKNIHTFTYHDDAVNYVKFSNDGKSFASASNDNTAIIYPFNNSYIVMFYFKKEIEAAIDSTGIERPKDINEQKKEYIMRMEEGAKYREKLIEEYYRKYIEKADSVILMK